MYPLLLKSIQCPKIWGCEHWVISAQGEQQTKVVNGELAGRTLGEVAEMYGEELLGKHVFARFGASFPLLLKFIDAQDDLSVQVHPNDAQAMEMEHAMGKNEMWYVLPGSAEEAKVVYGWRKDTCADKVRQAAHDGTLMSLLNCQAVSAGDMMQIDAGTVHALRAGTKVAEIQENSDITYRLYDYDRKDAAGNKRELHLDKALSVLRYEQQRSPIQHVEAKENGVAPLVHTPFYVTTLVCVNQPILRDYEGYDSFVAYLCTEGALQVAVPSYSDVVTIHAGEGMIIPAHLAPMESHVRLTPVGNEAKIIETFIP